MSGLLGGAAALSLAAGLMAPSAAVAAPADYDIDSAASVTVVVNKHRPLDPPSYVPDYLIRIQTEHLRTEAAKAYQRMAKAAEADRVNLVAVSGYRSYAHQASLYDSYVAQYGQATADTIAARPGYSEHQLGLAMDVANADGTCALQDCFDETPVGAWVAEHAWEYGFIIRYPENEQDVTGYAYEPWHLRYVGTDLAEEMQAAAHDPHRKPGEPDVDTMEEFFGLEPAPGYLP
ncbi:UNVERIFIED_CONTAM: M15 family metallopeptidase [Kocuria sp. CPCC 205316]|uniref:M15 family metallopeptidase n=1 Tax=Kocuria TaxID=57493 RepID=UPI0036DDAD88